MSLPMNTSGLSYTSSAQSWGLRVAIASFILSAAYPLKRCVVASMDIRPLSPVFLSLLYMRSCTEPVITIFLCCFRQIAKVRGLNSVLTCRCRTGLGPRPCSLASTYNSMRNRECRQAQLAIFFNDLRLSLLPVTCMPL